MLLIRRLFACGAMSAAAAFAADTPLAASPAPARQAIACDECGMIYNIRQLEKPVAPERRMLPDITSSPRQGGMGSTTQPVPLFTFGGGSGAQRVKPAPTTRTSWEITIRYDNGSFGFVNVDAEPGFAVGDRVRFVESVIEPLGPSRR